MRKAMQIEDQELKQIEEEYRLKNDQMMMDYEREMKEKEEEK